MGASDLAPRAGDVVLVDATSGTRTASRRRFGACGPAVQLGAIEVPGFGELAINAFARGFRAPFYSNALATQAAAAFTTVQGALNWFVDNFQRMADWKSSVNRVAILLLALDEATQPTSADISNATKAEVAGGAVWRRG